MMVFFEATETVAPQLLLGCNASQQENWLAGLLEDFEECGRITSLEDLQRTLAETDIIHLAVLLRKNRHGGVDHVEEMAQAILAHSPEARVLIIVGTNDKRGQEIVEAVSSLSCRTLLANGPKSPITAEAIQEEVLNFAVAIRQEQEAAQALEELEQEEETEEKTLLRTVYVEGAKGGCGCTTALVTLARLLQRDGQPVSILDRTGGSFYMIQEEEGIPVHSVPFDFPASGWVLIDGTPPEEPTEEGQIIAHVVIADPSSEAMAKVQERARPDSLLVINRSLMDIPLQVYEQEAKRAVDVTVNADPYVYTMKDNERILEDWQPLLEKLEAM